MSSWPCKNTGQPVALGNLFCVCRAYLSLCQNSTQSPVWRVTAPSRTKPQRSTCPAQTCGNAPFFTSVEGSYWHRVTLGEHCFVTKGLLTEEQMWRGKDAFHSYSGQQENYRHHETSHPDTKIVLLMTSHSLDMAAKGQGLQHCHTLNTHTHSGSYATEQVWKSHGSHCCDYSSTELWGEAKSQASGLVRVSPGKVIQYSHSVCVCGGF